jgi:hypothetical protein
MSARHFVQLFVAKALVEARGGKEKQSFETCRQSFRLGRTMNTVPILVSHMIYITCIHLSLDGLECLLEQYQPEPEVCEALLAELVSLDLFGSAARALEGERCFGNKAFEFIWCKASCKIDEDALKKEDFFGQPWFPKPLIQVEHAWYLDRMALGLKALRSPWTALSGQWSWEKALADAPWYCFLDHCLFVNLDLYIENTSLIDARVGLVRVALGLIHHQGRHQDLPGTLDALDAPYFDNFPLDPFTGSSFHYQRRPDGGFLLYSVGPNLKDDKGKKGEEDHRSDIVFAWAPLSQRHP